MEDRTLRSVLQTLGVGIAVCDPATWEVQFENASFFQWFPPDGEADQPLPDRVAGFDADRARSRLEKGRPYRFETDAGSGARTVSLEVEARTATLDGEDALIVECRNVSKQREAEYLLDSYSKMVERNTRELQREKERVEKLLLNLMPRAVYEELSEFGSTTPARFDEATILMLDFVGFTDMAISRDPSALIAELNDIFTAFDRIVELFGCERIKTVGDAYMAVAGLPEATPDHALNIGRVALRMRRYLERRNASHPEEWLCRIGIDSGAVIGSIVGVQKYVYDIFGPGVNLASRLEAQAEPMQILISEGTYALLRDDFSCAERGEVELKGFGTQRVYSLEGEAAGR
ncbi:MAG TPA: adenylate/guanylate cyclase domain-containing protein [Gaiellaceae bacterium]|nr:adenylate/guanylate cyclase domain-containing protein [Gaiellaceae bacterium]